LSNWRFDYRPSAALPPMAWLARIEGRAVTVDCGVAVRRETGGFFEGSWAGPGELERLPAATTVFGSGLVVTGGELVAITPSRRLANALQRKRRGRTHLSARDGNVVLRWAVAVVAPRYATLARADSSSPEGSAMGG
jgi:hypothetical protein